MKMKNLIKLTLIITVLISANIKAQDKDHQWMVTLGTNAIDYYPTNISGMPTDDGETLDWFDQYYNFSHYNFGLQFSVERYISDSFNAELSFSFNKIKEFGSITLDSKVPLFVIDLNANYNLNKLFGPTGFFEPYILAGFGYTSQNSSNDKYPFNSAMNLNGGLGAKFWITENFGARLQVALKYFTNDGSYRHFQHSIGLVYKFGSDQDFDNDGVPNRLDNCPEIFGLAEFNGCPDTDGDGIIDDQDACPTVAGILAEKGCPERDNDGDGVVDSLDKCKYIAGAVENNGCPWPDTDGDGILDKDDECPELFGSVAKKGCPEAVSAESMNTLKELARSVYFETDKAVFTNEAIGRLDLMLAILKQYPTAKFIVEGHTDDDGSEYFNQILSEDRANAVKKYFVSKGINEQNLTAKGFGSSIPLESNATEAGRAVNRRVEIKLVQ
ncbi:OmpA family protein [Lutibacter sp. HS1-25]|nr:OmpA family protein [Lutibacter sp. HS1-25]